TPTARARGSIRRTPSSASSTPACASPASPTTTARPATAPPAWRATTAAATPCAPACSTRAATPRRATRAPTPRFPTRGSATDRAPAGRAAWLGELAPDHRWAIALAAIAAMALSYFDRQTLSVLAPTVTKALHIDDRAYGWLSAGFTCAYFLATPLAGWVVD